VSAHGEDRLGGVGGLNIYWQCWLPEPAPRAVVVIAHGAGEHSGRYQHVAARLVSEGYAVYALDHRGHGRSEGARAGLDRMDKVVADLDALVVLAASAHPEVPVVLLGHSMGGAIALCYAMRHQARLAGLMLSGPLAALDAASPPVRMIANLLSALTPGLGVLAVDASLVSRDPAVVDAYVNDPLVHHGKLPARTVAELAKAVGSFPDGVGAITVPTLIMFGTADRLCPPAGSKMLAERIGASDKTFKPYQGLYHEILNEPEQDVVMDDICGWLAAHVSAVTA
jgi:alpha-beta hydrolase superfamily lysophospholipase